MNTKIIFYLLILFVKTAISQDEYELNRKDISKPSKKNKPRVLILTPKTFKNIVKFNFKGYTLCFDSTEIAEFNSRMRDVERFKKLNLDSLANKSLFKMHDTIVFNDYAKYFDKPALYLLVDMLLNLSKVEIIDDKSKLMIKEVTYLKFNKVYDHCMHSGNAALINDKYFYHEATSFGRLLD